MCTPDKPDRALITCFLPIMIRSLFGIKDLILIVHGWSPSTPATLVHVCAAVQSAKVLDEVEYRYECVDVWGLINTLSASHITGIIALEQLCQSH